MLCPASVRSKLALDSMIQLRLLFLVSVGVSPSAQPHSASLMHEIGGFPSLFDVVEGVSYRAHCEEFGDDTHACNPFVCRRFAYKPLNPFVVSADVGVER